MGRYNTCGWLNGKNPEFNLKVKGLIPYSVVDPHVGNANNCVSLK